MSRPDSTFVEQAREWTSEQLAEIETRLHQLGARVNAADLFVAVAAHLLIAPPREMTELSHGTTSTKLEYLAYLLLPLFSSPGSEPIKPDIVGECLELLERVTLTRPFLVLSQAHGQSDNPKLDRILQWAKLQAAMIRGSAYPEQTAVEIVEIQARFDTYFEGKVGLRPSRARTIVEAIVEAQQQAVGKMMPEVIGLAQQVMTHWREARRTRSVQRTPEQQQLLATFKEAKQAGGTAYVHALNTCNFAEL
jgi:hypothetical protein